MTSIILISPTITPAQPATSIPHQASVSPSGTISTANEFQGVGDALPGVATAVHQKTQTGVTASNTTSTVIPLFIDDVHGWKGTQVNANISNIKDTRDWMSSGSYNDSSLSVLESTSTRVTYDYWYPRNTTYFPGQTMETSRQVISVPDARAIRLHFQQITMQNNQDYVRVTNMEGTVLQSFTNIQSNVFSNWFEGSQLYIGYESSGSTEYSDGYIIDYIYYVPANETFTTLVESAHPYSASKPLNPGELLTSAMPTRPYMRAHFSLLDIEAQTYDYLNLYNNQSATIPFKVYNNAAGAGKIETTDRWTPWSNTNKISFNLSSDTTIQYDGFIVDKYQLSAVSPASFDTNAKRLNITVRWNNYQPDHQIANDQLPLQHPSATFMRVNFTHVNFEEGSDYLVLFDNASRFLMDFTGDHRNVLTPWFKTNRITLAYVSDESNTAEMPKDLAARIAYYEYSTASVDIDARLSSWTFDSDYYTTPGRASGYPTMRQGELGLALQIDGIDRHTVTYAYEKFSYEQTDKAEFNQLVPVPRGSVTDAYFSLDYYPDKVMGSNDFELYVAINDTVIFSRGFLTMGQNPRAWQSTGNIGMPLWSNTSALFANMGVSTMIKFQVGIRFNQPTSIAFSYFENADRQLLVVDDLKLVLVTAANATQADIDLRANGEGLTGQPNGLWGYASAQLSGDWPTNPLNVAFTTTSPSISFDVSLVLFVEASISSTYAQVFSSTGSSYLVQAGMNVSWTWYENVYIPAGYQSYVLNVSKPSTRVVESVRDPAGTPVPYNGGSEGSRWFSFTTTSPGWFSVNAHSRNYFDPVLLSSDNMTWDGTLNIVNQGQVFVSSAFRVPLSQPSGNGTFLIRTPSGSTWLSQPFVVAKTTGVSRGPFTFAPMNSTGGDYAGYSAWENGTEIGFRSFTITSTHASRLEISYPVDARSDNTTFQLVDSIVPVRILYNDTFSRRLIPGAVVIGSLNSTPVLNVSFTESTPGIYDYALDTAGLAEGSYRLVVTAVKPGFDNASRTLVLTIEVDTRVDGFTSFQEVQHGFNASITFHYRDVVRDLGITGAAISVSLTGVDHSIVDLGDGDYSISLNTTSLGLGAIPFSVNVQKPFHEPATLYGSVTVVRMSSHVEVLNGTITGYLGNQIGPFDIEYYHPAYPASLRFSGASITAYLDSGFSTKIPSSNYTVTDLGGGRYSLSISTGITTFLNSIGNKEIFIVAGNTSTSPFYLANDTASVRFIVRARPVTYSMFSNTTNITTESSFSVGIQDDFMLNMTVKDAFTGTWATGYAVTFLFSNGHSGTFSLVGNSYVTVVDHDDLSAGYFTLRISGTSNTHEPLQVQYVVSVQIIVTYIEGFVNYQSREHGTNATVTFHFHDALNDMGITGATVAIGFASTGVLNPTLYHVDDMLDGDYILCLNTTLIGLGLHAFTINVSKMYHAMQAIQGNLEVKSRLSTLLVLNSTISGQLADDIGPIGLKFYHPDFPTTLNYTQALFTLSLTPTFSQLVDPAGYTVLPLPTGIFSLSLKTGPGTAFTTAGVNTLFVRAVNSSSSDYHVANATATVSFILSLRTFNASIYINGENITSQTSITASVNQPLIVDLILSDSRNGSTPILDMTYTVSNGPSGTFTLVAGNYTANVMAGNFTTGVQTLSITSTSPLYALFARVFLITIIPREFDLAVRVNGTLLGQSALVSMISGTCMEIEANFTDVVTSLPLYGGRVNVTIAGVPVATFIVNASVARVTIETCGFIPGFHGVSIIASLSNYSAEYLAFTLEITRRTLRGAVSFGWIAWDGISPVDVEFASVVAMKFTFTDNATGIPVMASNVTLSPPHTIGTHVIAFESNNVTLTFNSSALGIGREYVTFLIVSARYNSLVIGIVIDVLPIPVNITIKDGQTTFQVKPSGDLLISIHLTGTSGQPLRGATVSYSWAGGVGTLDDMQNGTYQGMVTVPSEEDIYSLNIIAYLDENHAVATLSVNVVVEKPQLSDTALMTNTIFAVIIIGALFAMFFLLYLRPKIVKRRLVRFEEVKSCTVHKGPIKEGLTYVCPTCGSIYCTKCAQALFNNNDPCWSCATPIQPFAVSYQEDWRKNLQYVLIYQAGSREPIYEQSLTTEDVMMPEMLAILKRSIMKNVSKPAKKAGTVEVEEYFNSKILFGRGDFITLVLVSRIDSSFIHDKMKEFVESWELSFFDKEAGTWKADARARYSTKTRFMIDSMFVKEEVTKEEPKKGKGKGDYVDPGDLIHKTVKPSNDKHQDIGSVPSTIAPPPEKDEPVTIIPVTYPTPQPSQNEHKKEQAPVLPSKGIPAAIKKFLPMPPPENVWDGTPQPTSSPTVEKHADGSKPKADDVPGSEEISKNENGGKSSSNTAEDGGKNGE